MKVEDFQQAIEISDEAALESFLMRRHGKGVNSFWLSHEKYPAISILVKENLSSLIYFFQERQAGFRSIGNVQGLTPGGTTVFFLDNIHQEQQMINDSVVLFPTALQIAKEFFHSSQLPSLIKWFEL